MMRLVRKKIIFILPNEIKRKIKETKIDTCQKNDIHKTKHIFRILQCEHSVQIVYRTRNFIYLSSQKMYVKTDRK